MAEGSFIRLPCSCFPGPKFRRGRSASTCLHGTMHSKRRDCYICLEGIRNGHVLARFVGCSLSPTPSSTPRASCARSAAASSTPSSPNNFRIYSATLESSASPPTSNPSPSSLLSGPFPAVTNGASAPAALASFIAACNTSSASHSGAVEIRSRCSEPIFASVEAAAPST